MVKNNILTEDGKHIKILQDVRIDKNLMKYRKMAERTNGESDRWKGNRITDVNGENPQERKDLVENAMSYENLKKFMSDKNKDITDFNVSVTDKVNEILRETNLGSFINVPRDPINIDNMVNAAVDRKFNNISWFNRIKALFSKKNNDKEETVVDEVEHDPEFDVIGFFSDVHGLIDNGDETVKYMDRVSDLIETLGYLELSGQTAFKEAVIKKIVVNKLESVLYAKGMYKAISEEVMVKLCENAPKGLRLDYLANYTRHIPVDVVKKKLEVDKLCVFDNYAILHYDPDNTGTEMTDEEKEQEKRKRQDPILLGVISGSKDRLYFVSDWVDEHCDLTMDKLIDILGKEVVESGYIKDKIDPEK